MSLLTFKVKVLVLLVVVSNLAYIGTVLLGDAQILHLTKPGFLRFTEIIHILIITFYVLNYIVSDNPAVFFRVDFHSIAHIFIF